MKWKDPEIEIGRLVTSIIFRRILSRRDGKSRSYTMLIGVQCRTRMGAPLLARLREHFDGLLPHEVRELTCSEVIFIRHVGHRLLTTAHCLELGDADARTVELADDIFRDAGGAILGVFGYEAAVDGSRVKRELRLIGR